MLDLLRTHYNNPNLDIDTLALLDTDGSNFLEQDEFEEAFDGVTSEAELSRAFGHYDTDGTGEIDIFEFMSLMESITGMTYTIPQIE